MNTNQRGPREQFTGRIGHYEKLPDSLSAEDLAAVAKSFLPEACAKTIETLVVYAQGSAKYLAAIECVARRARFLARKANRENVIFPDIRNAIRESVIPSDTALAVALAEPKRRGRDRPTNAPEQAPQTPFAARPNGNRESQPIEQTETFVRRDTLAAVA